jgi:sensor histidine kinase YesM
MNRPIKLSWHLLIWTVFYILMLTIADSLLETVGMGNFLNMRLVLEIALILLLALVIPFYIFYFIGRTGLNRKTRIVSYSAGTLSVLLLPFVYLRLDNQPIGYITYLKMLVLVLFFSLLGYLFRGFLNGVKMQHQEQALRQQLLESELKVLKAQVSPHFLFNTLNNIDALITVDPPEASRSLISMAEMMRYMIYDTKENLVPLNQELQYLESLLTLYSLRFKKEGFVKFTVEGDSLKYRIPPMLLIPIAENAFKHFSNKHNDDGVAIRVVIGNTTLQLTSSNGYDPAAKKAERSGVGLETLKRRLELLYGSKYKMEIRPSAYTFNIELIVPLEEERTTAELQLNQN